jgi:hypothetical protein
MYPLAFVAVCMLIGELGRERQFAPPARWPR